METQRAFSLEMRQAAPWVLPSVMGKDMETELAVARNKQATCRYVKFIPAQWLVRSFNLRECLGALDKHHHLWRDNC